MAVSFLPMASNLNLVSEVLTVAYSDFTLQSIRARFSLTLEREVLFGSVVPVEPSARFVEDLREATELPVISEKSRNELIVMPLLREFRRATANRVTIYSGERFDVAQGDGLVGECDFLLTLSEPLPIIQSPVVTLLEAKKQDIESGLGQCAAQMIAALRFNERDGLPLRFVYGCVTTGETWQFLALRDGVLTIATDRYYIARPDLILGVLTHIVTEAETALAAPAPTAATGGGATLPAGG
jgi:hypothetical protein